MEGIMDYQDQLAELALLGAKFMQKYFAGNLPPDSVDKIKVAHAANCMNRYQRYIETMTGSKHVNFMMMQAISEDREELKRNLKMQNLLSEKTE